MWCPYPKTPNPDTSINKRCKPCVDDDEYYMTESEEKEHALFKKSDWALLNDPSLLNKVRDIKGKFEFVPVGGGTLQLHEKWKPDNNKNKD